MPDKDRWSVQRFHEFSNVLDIVSNARSSEKLQGFARGRLVVISVSWVIATKSSLLEVLGEIRQRPRTCVGAVNQNNGGVDNRSPNLNEKNGELSDIQFFVVNSGRLVDGMNAVKPGNW